VTLLSYAVLPRVEIAGLQQPSMATVLEAVVRDRQARPF